MRMGNVLQHPFRIVCVGDPSIKAHRYRLSGVFRYAAEHADLAIVSLGFDYNHGFRKSLEAIRHRITENHPDALVTTKLVVFPDEQTPLVRPDVPTACTQLIDEPTTAALPIDVLGIIDDKAICRAAVDLALKRGATNFAYVDTAFPTEKSRSELRFTHYQNLLASNGHTLVRGPTAWSRDEFANLRRLADWLGTLPKPCTVFTYADNRAHIVIDACHLAHLRVPDQVSVIGIDNDTEICETVQPSITSILPDFELGGYLAAQALHQILLSGKRPEKAVVYRYGVKAVIERGSTQDLRGGGRLVSQAQQIISEEFADPSLSAAGLAKRLNASRQLIDLRFREILGRTVHAEIERLRIAKAQILLRDSARNIGEIIPACGYTNPDTFRNAFKSATGLTPRGWRQGLSPNVV